MKNIILLLTIILFSCNSKIEKQTENVEKQNAENIIKEPKITGGKYFEYDEIEHYSNEIDEDDAIELNLLKKKSSNDSLKREVILGLTPKTIFDLNFINSLEKFGYKKSIVNQKKFKKVNKIFTEKKHPEYYETACIYIYRDILIFKKKSKIIGIAKICFTCEASIIVGTKSNTEEFGMSGDYEKLSEILNEN